MKKKALIFAIIVLVIFGFIFMFLKVKNRVSEDDFFKTVATKYYQDGFSGKITKKYIDSEQHNFLKIVVDNQSNKREVRLDYEMPRLFEYIKLGDSIFKKEKSLDIRLRRPGLDTLIRLNFKNIKNRENYSEFLYELDSIYDW